MTAEITINNATKCFNRRFKIHYTLQECAANIMYRFRLFIVLHCGTANFFSNSIYLISVGSGKFQMISLAGFFNLWHSRAADASLHEWNIFIYNLKYTGMNI